jgi:hypothetical protein
MGITPGILTVIGLVAFPAVRLLNVGKIPISFIAS